MERVHLKKIVGQLRNNICNVSVLSDPDLEMLSNMDPTNMADITGIDFIEQLKEVSGRLGGETGYFLGSPQISLMSRCFFYFEFARIFRDRPKITQ